MELVASAPAASPAAAGPRDRGPAQLLEPAGAGAEPMSGAAPFDWLLQVFGNPLPPPLPGGETLPVAAGGSSSNGLPTLSAATLPTALSPGLSFGRALPADGAAGAGDTAARDGSVAAPSTLSLA